MTLGREPVPADDTAIEGHEKEKSPANIRARIAGCHHPMLTTRTSLLSHSFLAVHAHTR